MLIVEKGRKKFYSVKIIIVFGSLWASMNSLLMHCFFINWWALVLCGHLEFLLSSSIVLWTNLAWMSWLFLMKFSAVAATWLSCARSCSPHSISPTFFQHFSYLKQILISNILYDIFCEDSFILDDYVVVVLFIINQSFHEKCMFILRGRLKRIWV